MSTHIDENGNVMMVDVSGKNQTERTAIAEGFIAMSPDVLNSVKERTMAKGDVLTVAQLAGIMGAKNTSTLIPLCHPLFLSNCKVLLELEQEGIRAQCIVKTTSQTGVEMEALTGVSVALLTIYDMCKGLDKGMEIINIKLLRKTGGKSGDYCRESK